MALAGLGCLMISTVEKVLFLKGHDLFEEIPGEDLAQIAQIADEVHHEEGDEIFQEGDPGDTLYLVVSGKVRVHQGDREVAVVGERQVVGEMSFLDSEPRSASVTALTDLTVLRLAREDFNEILAEKAEIANGFIKVLTRRWRNTLKLLADTQDRLDRVAGAAPSASAEPLDPRATAERGRAGS